MRALCDLVGLPVVNLITGEMVGEVEQIHWSAPSGSITGITVRSDRGLLYYPYDHVECLGQDAVFIDHSSTDGQIPAEEPRSLNGLTVYDHDGNELGSVDDLVIDLVHGKVSGLNVSGGLLRDIVQGRQFVPWETAHLGRDAIIVAGRSE